MTAPKYYYNLNRCISDGKTQFDTTNMPKETYEVNGQTYCGSNALMDLLNEQHEQIEQLKKRIDRIDIILDDLNGAEYISRDDAIKALNKIDKVVR